MPPAEQPVAAPATEPTAPSRTEPGDWYGPEIWAVDAAGILLGAIAAETLDVEPEPLNVVAATWYGVSAVGAPAVHYAHGNGAIGAGSLGIRLFVPPVVGFFGLLVSCTADGQFDGDCARPGWATGTMVGLGSAIVFDTLVAREHMDKTSDPTDAWYGWKILLLDGAAYAIGAMYASREPENKDGDPIHPAVALWVPSYVIGFIGAPILHFAHGEVGKGFGSLGLRLLVGPMFAVVGLMGFCAATSGSDGCMANGAQWGLLGGGLAVSAFDAFVLARQPAGEQSGRYGTTASVGPGAIAIRGYF